MINVQLLDDKIKESGKTKTFLASRLGITIQTLKKKCDGEYDFKLSEAKILAKEIGVKKASEFTEIFLLKE